MQNECPHCGSPLPPIFQDSIEMGSPSKLGAIKVYFNASNVDEANERVKNAIQVRDYMKGLIGGV